jgi:hypothetical protein
VRMIPRGVVISPVRARPSTALTVKENPLMPVPPCRASSAPRGPAAQAAHATLDPGAGKPYIFGQEIPS